MKSSPKLWFLIALLLRLIIMPLFYHPDMKSQYFHFQYLSQGKFNIYNFIAENKSDLPYRDTFNYLPLTYYFFGTINSILQPFHAKDFARWLNDWGESQNNYPNLPYYLLVLKFPYLVFDLLTAYLILKLTPKKNLYLFWLFNPLVLYLVYVLGNFDIVPMFLTLFSYYLLTRHRPNKSLFFLGLAVCLKFYPLLFLPFYFKKVKLLSYLYFLIPILVTILPFLSSDAFVHSFLGSGLTQKILEFKISNFPLFPILYLLVFIKSILSPKLSLPQTVFLVFLIFAPLVKFHPQWLIWFLPFVLLSLHRLFIPPLILLFFFALIYILLFNDQYLVWGHLIPVDTAFLNVRLPYDIIRYRLLIDPQIYQNYSRILIGLMAFITYIFYEKAQRTIHH